jgi:Yip1 domain
MENEVVEKQKKPKLFNMLWSPGEQLNRIRQNPIIWIPLLIVTILYLIGSTIMAVTMKVEDFMLPEMSTQEAEMIAAIGKTTAAVSGFLIPIITILISTVIYLIIVKIAKKDTTFKQLFSMNTFIMVIGAVGLILNNLIIAAIDGKAGIFITSLGGLLNSGSPLLGTFELFSIWQLILTAMGLHRVGQLSKTVSVIIVIIFFLIGLGFAAIGSMFSGMAGL